MPSKLTDLEKAQKKVDAASVGIADAIKVLRKAEVERDALIETKPENDSASLAHNVQAYQKSQKEYRASKLFKKQEIERLIAEVV